MSRRVRPVAYWAHFASTLLGRSSASWRSELMLFIEMPMGVVVQKLSYSQRRNCLLPTPLQGPASAIATTGLSGKAA